MVKIYYEYQFDKPIGQVISKASNFIYEQSRRIFIAAVNQYVTLISSKTGEVLCYLHKKAKNIPIRVVYYSGSKVYAGYEDGEIIVWQIPKQLTSAQSQQLELEQLYSFDLHKSTVTSICVTSDGNKMVSAGLDGNIMIWDLLSQECTKIKSAHPSAITQISLLSILYNGKPTTVILSIGKDGFFRVWNIENQICLGLICLQVTEAYSMCIQKSRKIVYIGTNKEDIVSIQFLQNYSIDNQICRIRGIFKKKSYARCLQIHLEQDFLYIANADKTYEIYKMLNPHEVEQRRKTIISRKKKGNDSGQEISMPEQCQIELKEVSQKTTLFKFYSICIVNNPSPVIFINNGTNIYNTQTQKEITVGSGKTLQLEFDHPYLVQRTKTDIRVYNSNLLKMNKLYTLGISSISDQLSDKLAQLAKSKNLQDPKTMVSSSFKVRSCCLFNSSFLLILVDAGVCLWNLANNSAVYGMPGDFSGCYVKNNKCLLWSQNSLYFYGIGYNKNKSIVMRHQTTKTFQQKIICASYKKKSFEKYLVCLENNQVWIQYSDTHKSFLKLYGHKLPILSYDTSDDEAIIATGSADKDIKIWDLDFGHCMKSIFAHQEAVTVVKFIKDTHYLISGSKDSHIKFWDADTYQLIIDLQDSILEIKDLVLGDSGDFIAAGGIDQGIRIWKQTGDQTIAADMEEKQMEKVIIQDYAKQKLSKEEKSDKTRYQDLKHGEQIIECLQNSENVETLLQLLRKIPPSNLKSCLSFLHERHIKRLQQYLQLSIQKNYEQQLCWRIMKQLDRGSRMGAIARNYMKDIKSMVKVNAQSLKILLTAIKDQNSMGLS